MHCSSVCCRHHLISMSARTPQAAWLQSSMATPLDHRNAAAASNNNGSSGELHLVTWNALSATLTTFEDDPGHCVLEDGSPNLAGRAEYTPERIRQIAHVLQKEMDRGSLIALQEVDRVMWEHDNHLILNAAKAMGYSAIWVHYGKVPVKSGEKDARGKDIVSHWASDALGVAWLVPPTVRVLDFAPLDYIGPLTDEFSLKKGSSTPSDWSEKVAGVFRNARDRVAIALQLQHVFTGKRLCAVNAHVPLRFDAPESQSCFVAELLVQARLYCKTMPLVVCGDFNLDRHKCARQYDNVAHVAEFQALADVHLPVTTVVSRSLRPCVDGTSRVEVWTFGLDYILASSELRVLGLGAFPSDHGGEPLPVVGGWPSDHLALAAVINLA